MPATLQSHSIKLSESITASDVYKQRCDDHRFYNEMRFKQLTLWSGATALLVGAALSDKNILFNTLHPLLIPSFGLIFTASFWIMEIRSTVHGIEALEATDPYKEILGGHRAARWTPINHSLATMLLYAGSFVIWARVALVAVPSYRVWTTIIFVATILFTATLRDYLYIWKHAKAPWIKGVSGKDSP